MDSSNFVNILISSLLTIFFCFFLSKLAFVIKLIDYPNSRKIHTEPVPLVGGISIVLSVYIISLVIDLDIYLSFIIYVSSIVFILGTGSNCTYYDGTDIVQKITSMGYVLMDDASGNYYGRQMLKDYFFNKMPPELALKFSKEYNLDPNIVKNTIYKKPNPQAYLATFAKFLIDNKNNK